MASLNSARQEIYDKFIADYDDETSYDLDNEDFTVPDGNTSWVRLVVRNRVGKQDSLGRVGNRRFLRTASVVAQVFVPLDEGLSEADRLATLVRDIFEGIRLSDSVWFLATDIQEIGPTGKFFYYTVESEFNYEETK